MMSEGNNSNYENDRPAATEYTSKDLGFLLDQLHEIRSMWKIIGAKLGISHEDLEVIKTDNDNTQEYLYATLTKRLKQSPILKSELCRLLRSPSIGAGSIGDEIEGGNIGTSKDYTPGVTINITATNALHCIEHRISDDVFPYTQLKKKLPTHVLFCLFIFLQIFTVLDDKVFRPKSYTVEEYANRVVFFILHAFLMVVVPSICYIQLCYLGKFEKKFHDSTSSQQHIEQIPLSPDAKSELQKVFKERKVSLHPLKLLHQLKPLLKFKGIEITEYQALIHSVVFPIFLYYLGLFHSTHNYQPVGAIESWRQRLVINGVQIIEVWECIAVTIILFLISTLKDLFCFENHIATLIAETDTRGESSPYGHKLFQAIRERWLPMDIHLHAVAIFFAILTGILMLYGDSFIPKYFKMNALEQNVWNILTVLVTIMQLGGSSASPDVKAFSIVGYIAVPLITCTSLYINQYAHETGLLEENVELQFAPGNILLLLYTTQMVTLLSWLTCLFHCYWRQNKLKTVSYHACLSAILLVVVCLCFVAVREFKHYNFNNFCTCKCE